MNKKKTIISVLFMILIVGLSIGAGLLIYSWSKGSESKPDETTEAGSETLPEPTTGEAPTEATEPESTETEIIITDLYDREINAVSSEILSEIAGTYSDDVLYYDTEGNRDENRISENVLRTYQNFSGRFDNEVHFFQQEPGTMGLSFILVTEYGKQTEYLLDQLKVKDVHATFFITSTYASLNPTVITRILTEGHRIGSLGASVSGKGISVLTLEEQQESLLTAQKFMQDTYQYDMKLFAFATSYYSEQSIALAGAMGYAVVFPTVTYPDYDAAAQIDANDFLLKMEDAISDRAVYSFHTTNSASLLVARNIISDAEEQGLRFTEIR